LVTVRRETPPGSPPPGAVSFLHRFGSRLNRHAHLHAFVTDCVFQASPDELPVIDIHSL
jgi:hypothetical protein